MGILRRISGRSAGLAAFLAVAYAMPAFAQDFSPVNTFFGNVGTALTGATGRAIGLVALAACGILFMMGRMNWLFAGSVMLGLVILYGAAAILAGF